MFYMLACLCILMCLLPCPLHASPGDWPMLRRDVRLTGRSELKGDIRRPQIVDRLFAGAWEGFAIIRLDGEGKSFTVPPGQEIAPDYPARHQGEWAGETMRVGRRGRLRPQNPEGPQVRYARILEDVPGLQKVEFEDAFSGQPTQKGYLYAFDQGEDKPRLVWQTEPEKDMYMPTLLITDADGDGLPEVAVATHYRVMIYNGQTGHKKTELRWHNMRNYGFFGAFTPPGERFPKFVVISDFVSHIDVLDYDGKQLRVLWRKDIEPTIIRKQKITRPGPNPIADLDGDGRPEIVLNLYNDTGDRRWHTTAFDALTGDIRFDWPQMYLHGLADLDGDNLPELFLEETKGLAVPYYGPVRLINIKGGKEKVLWSHRQARWQTTELSRLPLTANTGAADGRRTVLLADGISGKECFAVSLARSPGSRLARPLLMVLGREPSGRWASRAEALGPQGSHLEVKAFRECEGHGELLASWRSDGLGKQSFEMKGASGEAVSWRSIPGPTPVPIVARLHPEEPPTLVVQNGHEEIAAYQKKGNRWHMCWKRPGRGMTNGVPAYQGVLAADVDGDGQNEVLMAARARSGEAQLVAVSPSGRVRWQHTFQGFDGPPPIWNFGGLTFWTVGHFTSQERLDVFVTLRRSTMHSDEGFCLSGKDGSLLWHQEAVLLPDNRENWEYSRGYAGSLVAAADVNGDGLDELICAYPDRYWVASGKTGEIQKAVSTASAIFPDMWVAYATPVVADFCGRGGVQILWGGCSYITALLKPDGQPLWFGAYRDGPAALQGFGDVEGDGTLSIGGVYLDGFRCFDGATGKLLWTYPLPQGASGSPTVSSDIDGDGVEEFLFTHGQMLYALNSKGGKPDLLWSLEMPSQPGPPVCADIDGDGLPEILIGGGDGYIYIIGDSEKK